MSNSFLYPMLPSIITYEGPNGVKLVKWRIQPGHRLSKGTLMFISSHSGKEVKYKANAYGTTMELLVKEGDSIYNHDPIIKYLPCSHPTVMKDLCAECGRDLRELEDDEHKTSASVCMIHSVPELRVTQEQAEKLGKADESRLLKDGKLVLLVDLDQTLIHSTNEPPPEGIQDVFKYQLYGGNTPWYFTKLRPHTSRFLENISSFYELHICTFGARMYAHKIAELLDPSKKYFSHRILSRDECFDPTSKTGNLKALFPCGDSLVCIIDDRQDVWSFAPNLIAVKPYFFFKNTGDINSPYKPKEESFYNVQSGNLLSSQSSSTSSSSTTTTTTSTPSSAPSSQQLPSLSLSQSSSSSSSTSSSQPVSTAAPISESIKSNQEEDEVIMKEKEPTINSSDDNKKDNNEEDTKIKTEQTDKKIEKKKEKDEFDSKEKIGGETQEAEVKKIVTKPEISASSVVELTSEGKEANNETSEVLEGKMTEEREEEEATVTKEATSSNETEFVKEEESAITSTTSEPIKEQLNETLHSSESPPSTTTTTTPPPSPTLEPTSSSTEVDLNLKDVKENLPDSSQDTTSESKTIVDDADDYLLYLEDILKRIHSTYFESYKDLIKYSSDDEHIELPDLKKIIPQVRKKTLQGVNIVFSGLIPTNLPAEKSKLFSLAKSLGANVTKDIILVGSPLEKTTHLIAAKHGTAKVAKALKYDKINIVNPLWLYCCAERWEKVDEALFVLTKEDNFDLAQEKKLKSSPYYEGNFSSGGSGEGTSTSVKNVPPPIEYEEYPVYDPVTGKKVIKSRPKLINPNEPSGSGLSSNRPGSSKDRSYLQKTDLKPSNMLQFSPLSGFSKNDLQLMDKEVDDACSEGDELSTGNTDSEDEDDSGQPMASYKRRPEWESDEEAEMGGDDEEGEGASYSEYPKGWNKKSKKCKYAFTRLADDDETRDSFAERSDSTSNDDDYNESIGSVDEEMAAAVEREFLS